jgi:hypothetical protein
LKHVNDSSHISGTEPKNCLNARISNLQAFLLADCLDSSFSGIYRDLFEFEASASGLKGWDDFGYVVGNEAESCIGVVFFDD